MGQPVAGRALAGGVLGLAGICVVFWHDLSAFTATRGLIGLLIALLGAYLASIGNVVGSRNAKSGVPVTQANVYGMAYGALLCIMIHFGIGGELTMTSVPGQGTQITVYVPKAKEKRMQKRAATGWLSR